MGRDTYEYKQNEKSCHIDCHRTIEIERGKCYKS